MNLLFNTPAAIRALLLPVLVIGMVRPISAGPAVVAAPLSPVEEFKPAPLETLAPAFPLPARTVFETQVALARRVISPGSIDAALGPQMRAAAAAFERSQEASEKASPETAMRQSLTIDAPLLTTYRVTINDLARLQPLGKTWLEKSQQSTLDYETILELIAEKAHSHQEI